MAKSIIELSKYYRKLVDKEILKFIPNQNYPPNLFKPIWYQINSGGKRLRSTCAIVVYKSFNKDIKEIVPFAAACEVLHNWLLIHDDIEDGDVFRRGKPTVWFKYGYNTAINVGDFLSEKVYELILSLKRANIDNEIVLRVLELTVQSTLKTGRGQALDLYFRNKIPSEYEYLEMVRLKTGAYLMLPILGAAMIAGADNKMIDTMTKYGDFIGPAYQIVDDILDYNRENKNFCSDIKEGKRTLMIIHCLSKCTKQEKSRLIKILNIPREKIDKNDIEYTTNLLEKYGSIDFSSIKARLFADRSKKIIQGIKNSKTKDYLGEFADYIISRLDNSIL